MSACTKTISIIFPSAENTAISSFFLLFSAMALALLLPAKPTFVIYYKKSNFFVFFFCSPSPCCCCLHSLAHYNFIWTQSPAARPVVYTAALLIDYTYIAYNLWEVWWLDRFPFIYIFSHLFFCFDDNDDDDHHYQIYWCTQCTLLLPNCQLQRTARWPSGTQYEQQTVRKIERAKLFQVLIYISEFLLFLFLLEINY